MWAGVWTRARGVLGPWASRARWPGRTRGTRTHYESGRGRATGEAWSVHARGSCRHGAPMKASFGFRRRRERWCGGGREREGGVEAGGSGFAVGDGRMGSPGLVVHESSVVLTWCVFRLVVLCCDLVRLLGCDSRQGPERPPSSGEGLKQYSLRRSRVRRPIPMAHVSLPLPHGTQADGPTCLTILPGNTEAVLGVGPGVPGLDSLLVRRSRTSCTAVPESQHFTLVHFFVHSRFW